TSRLSTITRPPATSPFPYTTLFRSLKATQSRECSGRALTGASRSSGQSTPRAALPPAFILGQTLITARDQLVQWQSAELSHAFCKSHLEGFSHFLRIAMSSTEGLFNHIVGDTKLLQTVGGDAHRLGSLSGVFSALPENSGTPFWPNDRVGGVLQHVQLIAHTNGQRAT